MSYLIVDGNSIGHAAHSIRPLTVNGHEVQAVFGTLNTIAFLRENYPEYHNVFVLWDGRAQWRYTLYPEYKKKRIPDTLKKVAEKESYSDQMSILSQMLLTLGVTQIVAPRFEADDLAGYFVRKIGKKTPNARVKLVTGDKDWLQLVRPNVDWIDPRLRQSRHCTHETFEDYTGYRNPKEFLQAKALVGDQSDNIRGVPGIGEKTAQAIMQEFGCVYKMIDWINHNHPVKEHFVGALRRSYKSLMMLAEDPKVLDIFGRNHALMNLNNGILDNSIADDIKVTRREKDIGLFKAKCEELQFYSMTRRLSYWDRLF